MQWIEWWILEKSPSKPGLALNLVYCPLPGHINCVVLRTKWVTGDPILSNLDKRMKYSFDKSKAMQSGTAVQFHISEVLWPHICIYPSIHTGFMGKGLYFCLFFTLQWRVQWHLLASSGFMILQGFNKRHCWHFPLASGFLPALRTFLFPDTQISGFSIYWNLTALATITVGIMKNESMQVHWYWADLGLKQSLELIWCCCRDAATILSCKYYDFQRFQQTTLDTGLANWINEYWGKYWNC